MKRRSTPSFITEIPLITSAANERVALTRLEAGRQMYNACLGEGVRRVNLIKQSKLYQFAQSLPKTLKDTKTGKAKPNPERTKAFAEAWQFYDFSDYAMQAYAGQIRQFWIGEHIDADTAQKLGTRAFRAARNLLLGRAKRVRFKGQNQMDSLEGKSVRSPMKWQHETFVWKGLVLKPLIDRNNPVILHGLNSPVKYVRLVRRKINGKNRFYVQLINEGKAFVKPQHRNAPDAVVGLDIGPSTIAAVGDESAYLKPFCAELKDPSSEVARLQRKLSRSIRASNPDCFEPDRCDLPKPGQKHGKRKQGKAIKGQRQKVRSHRYRKVQARKVRVERKLAAQRKSLHGELGHKTVAMGRNIKTEKLSYKAFQRRFGRSVGKRAPGGFVARLKQIAENAGGSVQEFPTRETKLSQRCVCGRIQKKPLSERVHRCACGVLHQRDLWSAFLARHVDTDNGFQVGTALAEAYGVDTRLVEAWKQHQPSIVERLLDTVGVTPASEKVSREVSLSAAVDSLGEPAKNLDDVESVHLNRFESQNEAA